MNYLCSLCIYCSILLCRFYEMILYTPPYKLLQGWTWRFAKSRSWETNYCSYGETTAISFSWTQKDTHTLAFSIQTRWNTFEASLFGFNVSGVQESHLWNLWLNQSLVFSLAKKENIRLFENKSHFFMNYKSLGWIVVISADITLSDAFE